MLVSQKQQALVLNIEDPEQVLAAIPTAVLLPYKGTVFLVVPHRMDEVKVLRNLGYQVPSPIGYFYAWPGRYTPFLHQRETSGFLTLNQRAFCLNEIGTGKTLSTLWAADFLMQEQVVKRAIILAPLSTLDPVWAATLFGFFPNRTFNVVYGSAAKRRALLAQERDFYIINHDGIGIVAKDLEQRTDIDLIVIDEIAVYRNASTARFKLLKSLIEPRHWVWGLTGTPIPNAPTDAWAQCQLISPSRVPKFPSTFKNMVMQQLGMYSWVPRKEALDIVYDAMRPAIRFKRDDCLDLPECIYSDRHVEMSAEQKHHYKLLMDQLYTEIQGGQVTAANEGVKMGKLVQTACGVIYDNNGERRELDCKARVAEVIETIEEAGQKVIVFAPFTSAVEMVHREVSKRWTCEMVYGGTSKGQRDRIFSEFQGTPSPHVLVADAGTMSHGLTLTEASTILWYAPPTSNDKYLQANGRITRQGQKYVANIVHIAGSEIERRMYAKLKTQTRLQGTLLDMIEGAVHAD